MVYVEIVTQLLNAVISPQASGNENVTIRRGIAFEIMRGFLDAAAKIALLKMFVEVAVARQLVAASFCRL